ncbi:MAG: nucleotidyltransferase family protein [Deltaproteobacteria bacterium]|nr:nucleotidyltransferase family protein [Deltaproteobacteria bacterium]
MQVLISPQYIILFHYFREFISVANQHGIDVAPLKGAELLTSVYPPNEDRGLLADIDFLVKAENFAFVNTLLMQKGYVKRVIPGRKHTASQLKDSGYYLQISATKKILFEAHRFLVQQERHPINYEALWKRTIDSNFDGVPCKRLAPEDTFLHLIIHAFTDCFSELTRPLRDLELLIENQKPDFHILIARSKAWKCERALWLMFMLLKKTRNIDIDDAFIRAIAPKVAVSNVLSFLVPDENGFRFQQLDHRKRQIVLWPFLMDGVVPIIRFAKYYSILRITDFISDHFSICH